MASIGTKKGTEKAGGGITSNSIKDEAIFAGKLHPDITQGNYINYGGKGQPYLILATQGAVASGGDTVEHIAYLPSGGALHYNPVGAIAQSMKGPEANALGLRLDFDAAAGDGVNIVPGGLLGPWRHTIERTANLAVARSLFFRWRGVIEDVSGNAEFNIGFRKAEAIQAAVDNYDEAAYFNILLGVINIETILNNAVTVTTATTNTAWADGEEHDLMVVCHGNGKVEFFYDGKPPIVSKAFQFDDDEVVVPFIHCLQSADFTFLYTKKLEVGFLQQIKRMNTR